MDTDQHFLPTLTTDGSLRTKKKEKRRLVECTSCETQFAVPERILEGIYTDNPELQCCKCGVTFSLQDNSFYGTEEEFLLDEDEAPLEENIEEEVEEEEWTDLAASNVEDGSSDSEEDEEEKENDEEPAETETLLESGLLNTRPTIEVSAAQWMKAKDTVESLMSSEQQAELFPEMTTESTEQPEPIEDDLEDDEEEDEFEEDEQALAATIELDSDNLIPIPPNPYNQDDIDDEDLDYARESSQHLQEEVMSHYSTDEIQDDQIPQTLSPAEGTLIDMDVGDISFNETLVRSEFRLSQHEQEEALNASPQECLSSKVASFFLMFPVIGFLLLLLAIGEFLPGKDADGHILKEAISKNLASSPPAEMYLDKVHFSKLALDSGKEAYRVEGLLVNNSELPYQQVDLQTALFDPSGRTLIQKVVPASELHEKTKIALKVDSIESVKNQQDALKFSIDGGEQKAFAIYFHPEEAKQAEFFTARIFSVR